MVRIWGWELKSHLVMFKTYSWLYAQASFLVFLSAGLNPGWCMHARQAHSPALSCFDSYHLDIISCGLNNPFLLFPSLFKYVCTLSLVPDLHGNHATVSAPAHLDSEFLAEFLQHRWASLLLQISFKHGICHRNTNSNWATSVFLFLCFWSSLLVSQMNKSWCHFPVSFMPFATHPLNPAPHFKSSTFFLISVMPLFPSTACFHNSCPTKHLLLFTSDHRSKLLGQP